MEDLFRVLGIVLLVLVFSLVYVEYRKTIRFFKSLGANLERQLPLLLKGSLQVANQRFLIKQTYYHIVISTASPVSGYLSIERKFLGKGFDTFYDDEAWANKILSASKLHLLTESHSSLNRLSAVKIEGDTLKVELFARRIEPELEENARQALQYLPEVLESLKRLPDSSIGVKKQQLRNWLLYYLPTGLFILLSIPGVYWLSVGYGDTLCEDHLYRLGVRVLSPIFLAHFVSAILILGRRFHLRAHLFSLVVIYFSGYLLIPLTILDSFNARFDASLPKRLETRIVDKYRLSRGGHRLELEYEGLRCSHRVSERLYRRAEIGNRLSLEVKDGAFGVRWVYRYQLQE